MFEWDDSLAAASEVPILGSMSNFKCGLTEIACGAYIVLAEGAERFVEMHFCFERKIRRGNAVHKSVAQ